MYLMLARQYSLPKELETFSNCSTKVENTNTSEGQSYLIDHP